MKKITADFGQDAKSTFMKRGDTHTAIMIKLGYDDMTPLVLTEDVQVYLALALGSSKEVLRVQGHLTRVDEVAFQLSETDYTKLVGNNYLAEVHIESEGKRRIAPMGSYLEVNLMDSIYWEATHE